MNTSADEAQSAIAGFLTSQKCYKCVLKIAQRARD